MVVARGRSPATVRASGGASRRAWLYAVAAGACYAGDLYVWHRSILLSGTGLATLLANTVTLLRGERADEAVIDLAELAVARRGEVVAHVTAAGDLSEQQRNRLTEILSRIYSHPVSVQLNVDPAVLGGLQIEVADEVIDGSISSRLTAARAGLPD